MEFSSEAILERLKSSIKSDCTLIEGTFTMDNLQAVAEELATFYSLLIEPLQDKISTYKEEISTSGNEMHYVQWALEVTDAEGNPVVGNARAVGVRDGTGCVQVAILSHEATAPDEEVVALVQSYINARRPVGAQPIVSAAESMGVSIAVWINVKDGADADDVKANMEAIIRQYFVTNAFSRKADKLSYYKLGDLLFDVDGVLDIEDYTINEARSSLPGAYNKYFSLEELVLHVD